MVYGLCLPLAILVGYFLAEPGTSTGLSFISLVFLLLLFPMLLKWHHALLITCWNASLIVFFLPGSPELEYVVAATSLGLSILHEILKKQKTSISVTEVSRPLLALLFVVVFTIFATGGIGGRALGSDQFGAMKYLTLLGAILGYFAFVAQAVPPEKRMLMGSLFFLSGLLAATTDLAFAAGPKFYFLFAFFTNYAIAQAYTQETLVRFSGFATAGLAVCNFILMRYGISGLVNLSKPWRALFFVGALALSLLGGFRSTLVVLGLLFALQFYFEGHFRTKLLPIFAVGAVVVMSFTIVFVQKMPLAVQRSLSFLPIDVSAVARNDAQSTLDWRLQMWKVVVKDVPKFFWVGKGFKYDGTDYLLTRAAMDRGFYSAYEDTLITGNYHSGPLTMIIPFGIFGVLAFAWFIRGASRVLYANYLYGPPELKTLNTFFLAYFFTRLLFFLIFYGQFDRDLIFFTGAIGLNISINGGVWRPDYQEATVAAPTVRFAGVPAEA